MSELLDVVDERGIPTGDFVIQEEELEMVRVQAERSWSRGVFLGA